MKLKTQWQSNHKKRQMNAQVFLLQPGKQVIQECNRAIAQKKKKKQLTQRMIKPSLSTVHNQVSAPSTYITVSSCRQLFPIGTVTVFFSHLL